MWSAAARLPHLLRAACYLYTTGKRDKENEAAAAINNRNVAMAAGDGAGGVTAMVTGGGSWQNKKPRSRIGIATCLPEKCGGISTEAIRRQPLPQKKAKTSHPGLYTCLAYGHHGNHVVTKITYRMAASRIISARRAAAAAARIIRRGHGIMATYLAQAANSISSVYRLRKRRGEEMAMAGMARGINGESESSGGGGATSAAYGNDGAAYQ